MQIKYIGSGLVACAVAAVGCAADESIDDENVANVSQAEVIALDTECPYSVTKVQTIDVKKSLLITDTSVVNDECRTEWSNPTGCGSSLGKWTFWTLMDNMRGNATAAEFILRWLERFTDDATLGPSTLTNRSLIMDKVINPWREASGCSPGKWIPGNECPGLKKEFAPFRLLAIVNRTDLRAGDGNINNPYASGDAGEGRFVFGFLNASEYQSNGASLPKDLHPLQATVILEYGLPTQEVFMSAQSWAAQWANLSTKAFNTAFNVGTFNSTLEALTDKFTAANLMPSKPNSSAINQIRTDEIDFDPMIADPRWELREQHLECLSAPPCSDAQFRHAHVAQTPDNKFGFDTSDFVIPSNDLRNYLTDTSGNGDSNITVNESILNEQHVVPETFQGHPFLGYVSRQGEFSFQTFFWVDTSPKFSLNFPSELREVRRRFAISTCNGCHYNETGTQQLHIVPRDFNTPSQLSPFLSVDPTSDTGHLAKDPISLVQFAYNEPRRRVCELLWLKDGNASKLSNTSGRPH